MFSFNFADNTLNGAQLADQAADIRLASYAEKAEFCANVIKAKNDGKNIRIVGTKETTLDAVIEAFIAQYGDQPSADQPNDEPKPTGKACNKGEVYYWPERDIYAPMVNGLPYEGTQFDPNMWAVIGGSLPDIVSLKKDVIVKAKKAAEPTKYTYSITVTIEGNQQFESLDSDLAASELSLSTLNGILAEHGVDPISVTFGITKGKAKRRSSSTGQGSGFYAASDRSELKPLNPVQSAVLRDASSPDGLPLKNHAKYGRQDSTKLGNIVIEFSKKGYHGALRRQDGKIFFDPGAMYDGYEYNHSGLALA